jgi:Tfp pilus assembly protein PilE
MRRRNDGFSYVELLIGLAISLVMIVTLSMGLTYGVRLSNVTKAHADLLSAAQAEMERIRGLPFDRLESAAVRRPGVTGDIQVEQQTDRRKRVSVHLQHAQYPHLRIVLATYVHQHGLNR